MAIRQRVSYVLENERFIVERIETQFGHLNGVEEVVGGLEHVKFCWNVIVLVVVVSCTCEIKQVCEKHRFIGTKCNSLPINDQCQSSHTS